MAEETPAAAPEEKKIGATVAESVPYQKADGSIGSADGTIVTPAPGLEETPPADPPAA